MNSASRPSAPRPEATPSALAYPIYLLAFLEVVRTERFEDVLALRVQLRVP